MNCPTPIPIATPIDPGPNWPLSSAVRFFCSDDIGDFCPCVDYSSGFAATEAIVSLKPVAFRYKEELDPDGVRQFGLIAEQWRS